MTDIILCGKAEDHALSEILIPSLSRYGGVRFSSRDQIRQFGPESPAFLVWDCEQIPEVALESGVLVFKNSYRPLTSIQAVSYTHLDVYKRQEYRGWAVAIHPVAQLNKIEWNRMNDNV